MQRENSFSNCFNHIFFSQNFILAEKNVILATKEDGW